MLDLANESFPQLQRRLGAYVGRRMLIRSRVLFLARMKNIILDQGGLTIEGSVAFPLDRTERSHSLPKEFRWHAPRQMLTGGDGMIAAVYVSWAIFYDDALNEALCAEVDSTTADVSRMNAIFVAWQDERERRRAIAAYPATQSKS